MGTTAFPVNFMHLQYLNMASLQSHGYCMREGEPKYEATYHRPPSAAISAIMMPFLTPISAILQCNIHHVKGTGDMGPYMPYDGAYRWCLFPSCHIQ